MADRLYGFRLLMYVMALLFIPCFLLLNLFNDQSTRVTAAAAPAQKAPIPSITAAAENETGVPAEPVAPPVKIPTMFYIVAALAVVGGGARIILLARAKKKKGNPV